MSWEYPDLQEPSIEYMEELEIKLADAGQDIHYMKMVICEMAALLHTYHPAHGLGEWRKCPHKDCVRAREIDEQ